MANLSVITYQAADLRGMGNFFGLRILIGIYNVFRLDSGIGYVERNLKVGNFSVLIRRAFV